MEVTGVTNNVNDCSIAQYQSPRTSCPKWNAAIINAMLLLL